MTCIYCDIARAFERDSNYKISWVALLLIDTTISFSQEIKLYIFNFSLKVIKI